MIFQMAASAIRHVDLVYLQSGLWAIMTRAPPLTVHLPSHIPNLVQKCPNYAPIPNSTMTAATIWN